MANSPQARKRARQNDKRREHLSSRKSKLRSAIKKAKVATSENSKDMAKEVSICSSVVDKAANKNIIHPNKASRIKSRIARQARKSEK